MPLSLALGLSLSTMRTGEEGLPSEVIEDYITVYGADGPVSVSSADESEITFTIPTSTRFTGTYVVTLAQVADGALVFLEPPDVSGTEGLGEELTPLTGLVVGDDSGATVFSAWDWYRSGDLQATSLDDTETYTITQPDLDESLQIVQNVQSSYGAASETADAIGLPSYTETEVQSNQAHLLSPVVTSLGSPANSIAFAKIRVDEYSFPTEFIISGNTSDTSFFSVSQQSSDSIRFGEVASGAGSYWEADAEIGDVISLLIGVDVNYYTFAYQINDGEIFTNSVANTSEVAPNVEQFRIGRRYDDSRPFLGGNFRLAQWFGLDPYPDVTDETVFRRFVNADGTLASPLITRSLYGTPAFDFEGAATGWNAGTHGGSLAAFTYVDNASGGYTEV